MKQPTLPDYEVGDDVLVLDLHQRGGTDGEPWPGKVTRVGRKWIYVERLHNGSTGGTEYQFDRADGYHKSTGYGYGVYHRLVTVETLRWAKLVKEARGAVMADLGQSVFFGGWSEARIIDLAEFLRQNPQENYR